MLLLVADDSPTIQKVIRIAFARYGVEIVTAASLGEAIATSQSRPVEAILADAALPGSQAPADFVRIGAGSIPPKPIILLVGSYENIDEATFLNAGISRIVRKPFESSDMVKAVEAAIGRKLPQLTAPPDSLRTTIMVPGQPPINMFTSNMSSGATPSGSARGLSEPEPLTQMNKMAPPPFTSTTPRPSGSTVPPPPPPDQVAHSFVPFRLGDDPLIPDESQFRLDAEANQPEPGVGLSPPTMPGSIEAIPTRESQGDLGGFASPMAGLTDESRKGRKAFSTTTVKVPENPFMPPPLPVSPSKGESETLVPLPDEWKSAIKSAVEAYCSEHFAAIAREVLTAEIRRLAEERARHLIDQ